MALGSRERKQLRSFLLKREKLSFKPSSKLMTYLENDYADIYQKKKDVIFFSTTNKQFFRQELTKDIPDLFAKVRDDDDRVDSSIYLIDEKQAPVAPEQSHVTLAHHRGAFSAAGFSHVLPLGVSIRIALKALAIKDIDTLVVIENLNAFDHWYKANWSELTPNTYAVYRGHDKLTKGTESLIEQVAKTGKIVAFCDYDPKGVEIALTLEHVSAFLKPVYNEAFVKGFNQKNKYTGQYQSVTFLQRYQSKNLSLDIDDLCNDLKPLAIMQEHVLAHNIPLDLALVSF